MQEQRPGSKSSAKIRDVRFQLIDGETGNPIPNLKCTFLQQTVTTDSDGIISVQVGEDQRAWIQDVPPGWFSRSGGRSFSAAPGTLKEMLGENSPTEHKQEKSPDLNVITLYRGTQVKGRLLWPDGTPAAGVHLYAGVYINSESWNKKLGMGMGRVWVSWDQGQWPNWTSSTWTDDQGLFLFTMPPKDARSWLRVATTNIMSIPSEGGVDKETTERLSKCVPLEIQYGGHHKDLTVLEINDDNLDADQDILNTGDLSLKQGIIVRGCVVDAAGNGLSNVGLTTPGPHGPHSGRSTTSDAEGRFAFAAMAPGPLRIHPDARLRDALAAYEPAYTREVQAVFVDQTFTITETPDSQTIEVRAEPHTEVRFEWIDRRADQTQALSYYGTYEVYGQMPDKNGVPGVRWTGQTVRAEQDGKQWLTIKVPQKLLGAHLRLPADQMVTASYSDSSGVQSGPGRIELGDCNDPSVRRTIFGDEPRSGSN